MSIERETTDTSAERRQLLVVDDEPNLRRVLSAQLVRDGYDVHTASDGDEAYEFLKTHHVDLVITDLKMPGRDGMQLLRAALELDPALPVVILTAHGTVDNAVEALKTGAFDYITKPFDQDEVRAIVAKALRASALNAQEAVTVPVDTRFRYGIIGNSSAIKELYSLVEQAANTPTPVLILGESGTGKELVARALHQESQRAARPFIKVNCAALLRDSVERELFGYERGLSDSEPSRPGRLELAHGGSILLNEVQAIPTDVQVRLLEVLQQRELRRVGASSGMSIDLRLIAATEVDLKAEVDAGHFRDDLFYRLSVVSVRLPPLRERVGDIALLANYFVETYAARLGKSVRSVSPEAQTLLEQHPWPGNIRELENVIERAVLFSDGSAVQAHDLPAQLTRRPGELDVSVGDGLKEQVKVATARLERELIDRALKQTGGNVTHAARLLKISRKGLQLKMKELGLRERDDKADG